MESHSPTLANPPRPRRPTPSSPPHPVLATSPRPRHLTPFPPPFFMNSRRPTTSHIASHGCPPSTPISQPSSSAVRIVANAAAHVCSGTYTPRTPSGTPFLGLQPLVSLHLAPLQIQNILHPPKAIRDTIARLVASGHCGPLWTLRYRKYKAFYTPPAQAAHQHPAALYTLSRNKSTNILPRCTRSAEKPLCCTTMHSISRATTTDKTVAIGPATVIFLHRAHYLCVVSACICVISGLIRQAGPSPLICSATPS